MADFTVGMTGASDVADSRVIAFTQAFIIENEQSQVLDGQIVSIQENINAKSFNFPRYSALALSTAPLTAKEDPASEVMADTEIVITPAEHGNVLTTTRLANLQSGGKVDVAAAQLVGRISGRVQDKLAMEAMDASAAGQQIFAGSATSTATVAATDVADTTYLEDAYNKLARNSIPAIGADGLYVAVMHDDVISDLRDDAGAGSWTDINKYNNEMPVLRNEVGLFKGFRIVRQNDALLNVDGGVTTTDVYSSYFIGMNGLGKAISQAPSLTITGPFDKLGRFLNIGWYGVLAYSLVEAEAVVMGQSASSRGAN